MASASDRVDVVRRRFIRLESTLDRVDQLARHRQLRDFDVSQIYSGIFLDAFVAVERLIEDLFLGYLVGAYQPSTSRVTPSARIPNRAVAAKLIRGERRYVDWLPYRLTRARSDVFFRGASPFQSLDNANESVLEELGRVRNVIAHRSPHALDIFNRLVLGNLNLRPRDKDPARFLRLVLVANPRQTKLQMYLADMLTVCQELAK